jgi:hypothetical protein
VVNLVEIHHLVLLVDQGPVHDRHHELDHHLDTLGSSVVPLLLMMMVIDSLCQLELELEPHEASLHRCPF